MAAAAAVAQLAAFSNVAAGGGGVGGGNHAATTAENILDLSSKLLAQQQHQVNHQTSPGPITYIICLVNPRKLCFNDLSLFFASN